MKATQSSARPETDLLLVTATAAETKATRAVFLNNTAAKPQELDGRVYFDLGLVNGARIKLTQCEMGAGGLNASQQAVAKGIATLAPQAVVMLGIAFGIDPKKQQLADVLVSERLRPYDLQRIGTRADGGLQVLLRDDKPHASPWLLNLFRSADADWTAGKVRFGTMFSGAKLVDNKGFREALRKLDPEAIGGEMEGAGLYVACEDRKVDWIMVKAICDFADGQKKVSKEKRQRLAAENAATFVRHAIEFASIDWRRNARSTLSSHLLDRLLGEVLELAVDSARTPLASAPINARYFFHDKVDGRAVLRRHERLYVERTVMVGEHGLDYADIEADDLAICKAFRTTAPVFKVLAPPSERTYNDRLRHQIDDRQKWALGIPVIVDGVARGVVCLYSTKDIGGESEQQTLLEIASRVAKIFAHALALNG